MAHHEDTEAIERMNQAVLVADPNGEQFATKVMAVSAALLVGVIALSWLGHKAGIFKTIIHYLGGH